MEPTRSSGAGSGNSGTYWPEMVESLRFEEEIQSLMLQPTFESAPVTGSSFIALLGLAPTQAVELLHNPQPPPTAAAAGFRLRDQHEAIPIPLGCFPTFPSNAALIDRAARFSVFAAEESSEVSNSGEITPPKMKSEPAESGDSPIGRAPAEKSKRVAGNKRKEAERKEAEKSNSKVKGSAKKSKSAEESTGGDEKLPYVHVRARRGQATDSHSLAERARREKINARMKLLQELVPGCSKISGTALVLDEIINHVQSLQRQVEFLSMRLAAVNPRIDFSGLDRILSSECGRLTAGNGRGGLAMEQSAAWLDGMINGGKQQHQQQMWLVDPNRQHQQPQPQQTMWDRDETPHSHIFVSNTATALIFDYGSSNPSSVPPANQLKTASIAPDQAEDRAVKGGARGGDNSWKQC